MANKAVYFGVILNWIRSRVSWFRFFTRDSIYSIARICHANSVRPSVCHTRVLYQNSWTYHRNSFNRYDRPIILVFRHRGSLHESDGFTPNGGAKYKGIAIFDQYAAISCKGYYIGAVTMEDEYKVVCALSNSAAFDDLEWPRIPVSRSQYSLKANISQMVHPIHSMFGSRLGFAGLADRMVLSVVR